VFSLLELSLNCIFVLKLFVGNGAIQSRAKTMFMFQFGLCLVVCVSVCFHPALHFSNFKHRIACIECVY
jgi:hypothetical protein